MFDIQKYGKHIIFQAGVVIKTCLSALQCKLGLCCFTLFKVLYFRRLILIFLLYIIRTFSNQAFNISSICFRYVRNRHKSKHKIIITSYKEFFGTCIKSKKNNIYTLCINYQKFYKLAVFPHMALQHVKEAFADIYSSSINIEVIETAFFYERYFKHLKHLKHLSNIQPNISKSKKSISSNI